MNDKQNDKQRYPGSEERIAEQTVRMLEARTNEASSKDDQATTELGQLLRDAAQANLPESNVDLREQLIAQLDGGLPASEQVTVASKEMASDKLDSRSTGRRRFWVAAAASGLLLVGGAIAYNSDFVGTLSDVAMLEDLDEVGVEPEVESSVAPVVAPSKPVIPDAMQVPYTADGKRIEKADYGKYGLDAGALFQATEKEALVASNRSIDLLRDAGRSLEKPLSQEKVSRAERLNDLPGRFEGSIQNLSEEIVRGPVIIAPSIGSPIGPALDVKKSEPLSPPPAPAFAESRGVNGDSSGSQSQTNQDGQPRRRDNGAIAGERFQFPGSDNGLESTERIDLPGNVGGIAGRGPGGGGFGGGRVGGGDGKLAQQRLSELTQELARSEAALKGGQDAMMERIWILEEQGKVRKNSMQPVDGSAQIAAESRTIEGLELQRDQLIVVQKIGPGHSQIQALDIAINDRKAKIAELESQRARVTGRGPKQVLQSSIDSMKQQVNDLQNRIGEASRPAEFLAGGEIPFEESAGKRLSFGVDSAKGSGSRASAERERRIIKELELQRDQLAVTRKLGPGHGTITALDLAINDSKARLAALEASSGEQYEPIFENAFIAAKGPTAISTFSIDVDTCLLYTSPSPRDQRGSRMPSSA